METTTTTEPEDYWTRRKREDAAQLANMRGRIVEIRVRAEEANGDYHDVFYVTAWTGEGFETLSVGASIGRALVADASGEIIEQANDYLEENEYDRLVREDLARANTPARGKLVTIARGRATLDNQKTGPSARGFEGVIFWEQEVTYSPRYRNGYKKGPDAIKVGIAPVGAKLVDGKREGAVFTYSKNCDVLNADMYMTDPAVLRDKARAARRLRAPAYHDLG